MYANDAVYDLHDARDMAMLEGDWLQPACEALRRGDLHRIELDLADGRVYGLASVQRWRFWRKPLMRLQA
jgi:hypothetical protein